MYQVTDLYWEGKIFQEKMQGFAYQVGLYLSLKSWQEDKRESRCSEFAYASSVPAERRAMSIFPRRNRE